ncbi:hypothetical protein DFJ74DRAFT_706522 [Hyaloraphidium curvatum]|nr:hypothetical protein DFJ74DRAFT_706522 [Hyaloraphidium curvatum]
MFSTLISPDFDAVVFELGSFYLRGGLSDEAHPRFVVPWTTRGLEMGGDSDSGAGVELRVWPLYGGKDSFPDDLARDRLRESLHSAYDRHLLADSGKRKVLVVVNGAKVPAALEFLVQDVLAKELRVPLVRFVDANAAATLAHGRTHGLVVDIGFWETTVTPVFDYTPLLPLAKSVPLGGNAINQELLHLRGAAGHRLALDDTKFELIVPADDTDGRVRAADRATEILFAGDEDGTSVADCILSSLAQCPLDIRKPLAGSIVLTGGVSMLPGLAGRLFSELRGALKSDARYTKIRHLAPSLRISTSSFPASSVCWAGGSLYAATVK